MKINEIIVKFLNEKYEEEIQNNTNLCAKEAKFNFHRLIRKDMEYFKIENIGFSISYEKNYSIFHKKFKKIFLELVELLKENKRNDLIQKINFIELNIKDDFVEGSEIRHFLQRSLYDIEFRNNEFKTLLNNKFDFEEDVYYSLAVLENEDCRLEERLTIVKQKELGQTYPFITSDANAIFNTLYYILEFLHKEEEENKNEKLSR